MYEHDHACDVIGLPNRFLEGSMRLEIRRSERCDPCMLPFAWSFMAVHNVVSLMTLCAYR